MIQLISYSNCPYILAIRYACLEQNIAHELQILDANQPAPQWFLSISAKAETPCLQTDNIALTSYGTILEYINDLCQGELLTGNAKEKAQQRCIINDIIQLQTQLGHLYYANEEEVFIDAIEFLQPQLQELATKLQNIDDLEQNTLVRYSFAALAQDIVLIEQVSKKSIFNHPILVDLSQTIIKCKDYQRSTIDDYQQQQHAFFIAAGGFLEDCINPVDYSLPQN